MQLRFTSLVVTNSRRDFHPQEYAHAGRTVTRLRRLVFFFALFAFFAVKWLF